MKVLETVPLLLVSDIETSRDFYCSGLGFREERDWKPEGALAWCLISHGSASLMLQKSCESDPPPSAWDRGVTFYFMCEDADAAFRELRERGVDASDPVETFYGMRQTFVTDPDGYLICFENDVTKQG